MINKENLFAEGAGRELRQPTIPPKTFRGSSGERKKGVGRNRTAMDGFAIRCLAIRPQRHGSMHVKVSQVTLTVKWTWQNHKSRYEAQIAHLHYNRKFAFQT